VCHTADLDEARELTGRYISPHRLSVVGGEVPLDVQHHSASIGHLAFNYLQYGASVAIDPEPLKSCFLIQIPLSGISRITVNDQHFLSTPETIMVINPTDEFSMVFAANFNKICIKIDHMVLENRLRDMLGAPLPEPLSFYNNMDATRGAGASLRALAFFLLSECEREGGLLAINGALDGLENTMATLLITGQQHNYSSALATHDTTAMPRHVKRALDFMLENAARPLTISDLAAVAQVSPRTLHDGFRRFRGTSPMACLRSIRITRAREDLLTAPPGTNVTNIALRWGFNHLGRFSQEYKKRYGETPSQTLNHFL
jgi:AraC-like DNA-binding protein